MNNLAHVDIVPVWVNWIAQDADGGVWGYEAEPHLHDSGWYENEVGRVVKLDQQTPVQDWQDSLRKLD